MSLHGEGKEFGPEGRPGRASDGDTDQLGEKERALEIEMDLAEERAVQGINSARFRMDRRARASRAWMGAQDFSSPSGNWGSGGE